MSEAWRVREFQQQRFIEELAREVRDRAEESGDYDYFIIEFSVSIFAHFLYEKKTQIFANASVVGVKASQLLERMIPRIREFARVASERRWLLFQLFENLRPAIGSWAQRDYLRDQFVQPQTVFGAPSATAEILEND